jgi:glycosyltransferase involved in cell wall biosynthesis
MAVHVIVGLNVGGAELMLRRLIHSQRVQRLGLEHHVISLTTVGEIGAQMQAAGFSVSAMGVRSVWQTPLAFLRLVRLLSHLRPDVVQTWMYHADLLGGFAARLAGCRNVIWGIRTTEIAKGGFRATALVRWLCARLSCWVPHTIVCAARAAQLRHARLGYCTARMVVIPNGFDLARLQASAAEVAAMRQTCGFGPEALVVGTLGRFNVVKDQLNFVRAAGLLAPDYPSARFLLVGRGCDAANSELTSWIAATGFAQRFVLLGERSDAPVCLAAMDVFALPSRTEGFPNVLAEAMAMGRPCVTTDVGDAASVLGGCGILVPAEDSPALAQGMARLLSLSQQERVAIGESAQQRIAKEFSMERCAQLFADVYADVLNNSGK